MSDSSPSYPFVCFDPAKPEHGRFSGPGLSGYEVDLTINDYVKHGIQVMLKRAFEAGRRAKTEELRVALGVHP